ncbi:uncharacterized protein TNCT_343771 [Trichonephila clavata]|uniref:Retrovirus-related Pol polyprotein from transposon TNT 1-94-like beta-barrel domain-containing protein n=1 Tax=Trichonephila clavata TaxID=2740835 RepID=A0A8X6F706_TRICU|nr:uncharacterized protein TNCT_343771 [Trichonephila clavata]
MKRVRAYQTVRKKSQQLANKKIRPTRDDVKCTKVSRSSYITETNLRQYHEKDIWIFDTEGTSPFCCQNNFLQNFQPVNNMRMTVAVGGMTCEIKGNGTVSKIFQNKGEPEVVDFKNIFYSPKLQKSHISGSLIDKAGSICICKKGQINASDNYGHKVFTAE